MTVRKPLIRGFLFVLERIKLSGHSLSNKGHYAELHARAVMSAARAMNRCTAWEPAEYATEDEVLFDGVPLAQHSHQLARVDAYVVLALRSVHEDCRRTFQRSPQVFLPCASWTVLPAAWVAPVAL